MKNVVDIFLDLVSYDTKADYKSNSYPSSSNQLVLAKVLQQKCLEIGLTDVLLDKYGYVTATLNSNVSENKPVIAFIAHMDTSPDFSGKNVKPQIIKNYDGGEISLQGIKLSPNEFSCLKKYKGQDLITTDGTTLLGADDKAGVAEILAAMEILIKNPDIPHGKIKICFTPDEEVGHGVDYLDIKKLGADFGYTIDGGEVGELEYENFNAAIAYISIQGKAVHPGSAKNIMINASLVANDIINCMPQNETPATTENYEGYFHLHEIYGGIESAKVEYTIRDFDKDNFEKRKKFIIEICEKMNQKYGENTVKVEVKDQYYNMFEVIEKNMHIYELAKAAIEAVGIEPITKPIRGGTDGSRLSFMGLPCPNIFTGGHNAHGPYEFISIQSMEKAVEVIVKICEISTK